MAAQAPGAEDFNMSDIIEFLMSWKFVVGAVLGWFVCYKCYLSRFARVQRDELQLFHDARESARQLGESGTILLERLYVGLSRIWRRHLRWRQRKSWLDYGEHAWSMRTEPDTLWGVIVCELWEVPDSRFLEDHVLLSKIRAGREITMADSFQFNWERRDKP